VSAETTGAPAPASPSPEKEGAASSPARPAKHSTRKTKDRVETYEVERPDGTRLKVVRNIETGEATYTAL
jgi:hypothetical protein